VAAALPQTVDRDFTHVGKGGKREKAPTGLEPIKRSLPWDEWAIAFERTTGSPQIDPVVAASTTAQVNIALSKVAPPHVRTEAFKISPQGRLTTAAQAGASVAMLLVFKREIIEVAKQADRAIINVVANETWVELKILVPYTQYRHDAGLADLRERIEAENEGVVIPPFSMRWMRAKRQIVQHYQAGTLPQNAASVVFKVCSKVAGNKMLTEMWVVGVKFRALPFIVGRADALCGRCSRCGHSEFRCHQGGTLVCAICVGPHRTEGHKCEVVTCGKTGRVCSHTAMRCPNCGGGDPAQDGRCKVKAAAIDIARWGRMLKEERRALALKPAATERAPAEPTGPMSWVPGVTIAAQPVPDRTEDAMEIAEEEPSGTAPPIAV